MPTTIDFTKLSRQVADVLRKEFGPDVTVRTDEGWHGRIHVKVVSNAFDDRASDEKQEMVWQVLKRELGEEADAVALVLAYGMDEI